MDHKKLEQQRLREEKEANRAAWILSLMFGFILGALFLAFWIAKLVEAKGWGK